MVDSKKYRIENLKNTIEKSINTDELLKKTESLLNEDDVEETYEKNDEFIYNPNKKESNNINLDIDEKFLIKPDTNEEEQYEDIEKISKTFDKIKTKKIIPIIGSIIGIIILLSGIYSLMFITDRIVDNVSSGESITFSIIFIIIGLGILIYSIIKITNIKTPFSDFNSEIEKIDEEKEEINEDKKQEKNLKKPTSKEIINLSIEEKEYEKAKLENETIEEIFNKKNN